ncbi:MAG: hypothetical protein HS111_19035 [Kofleriaceae bacterium]|nr:hypothetical protein [Kofleriaceae bacterium]
MPPAPRRPRPSRGERAPERPRGGRPRADGPRSGPRATGPRGQRRALSMPSTPGPSGWGGDRQLGPALEDALLAAGRDDVTAESLTHPVHPYPARLHPATAARLDELVMHTAPQGAPLLDPFCGSGTVLIEARAAGYLALGVDLNPLAVRLARVKTWTAPVPRRKLARELGRRIAGEVMHAGREARRAGATAPALRAPPGFDPNARQRRIGKWFSPHVRRELEAIAAAIDEVAADDAEVALVLTMALSGILYKVSHRRSDTDPSWVERKVARGAAARLFGDRVEMIVAGLDDLARVRAPMPRVVEADARALASLGLPPAVGVVTSPPYAGTYDYAEQHRLRFDFLGLRHRAFDEGELGPRRHFLANSAAATTRWRAALGDAVGALVGALEPGRLAALVVGDSLAGKACFADEDLRAVLDDRVEVLAWAWQERPKLGPERHAFGDRPKREHVVVLHRTR